MKRVKAVGKKAGKVRAKQLSIGGKSYQAVPTKAKKSAKVVLVTKIARPANLDALLNTIRIYLQISSHDPAGDWREIRRYIEDGFGFARRGGRPLARKAEGKMSKPKEGIAPVSKADTGDDSTIRPPETAPLDQLLVSVLENPSEWLASPSAQFGGRKPADLIGTNEERKLIDLLIAVDQGLF